MKQSKTFASGFPVEETIESLRQQLAEKDAEIEHLDRTKAEWKNTAKVLGEKLAASQAREAKLRGQILRMIDRWWPFVHKELFASDTARDLYREASDSIQPPHVTSALEALIAKAGEVMRERCLAEINYNNHVEVRALPCVTLEDLK